jgi:hypothetical protein
VKDFGEFNIEPLTKGLKGEKLDLNKVINVNIIIEAFRIGPSKFEGKSERLDMQIIYKNEQRLIWVSSASLVEMIKRVPENGLPFRTRIEKEDSGRLIFKSANN